MRNVTLILDDGSRFHGKSFGYEKPVAGEVVFNTAMTGYPESLTDPSYAGQLMTLTYPLVGNYGVPPFTFEANGLPTFMESEKIHAEAIIVSDYSEKYSHWNAVESLGDWLKREQIPGITGIDTRELTKVLREHGVMMGKIVFDDEPNNIPEATYAGVNYVDKVSCKEVIRYNEGEGKKKVVLVDCGVKSNIIRCLLKRDVEIIRVPWNYDFNSLQFDGLFISNGPGDPEQADPEVNLLRQVLDAGYPFFGICFGNQLLGRALGFGTYKLKFGHRGINQPVKDLTTGKVEVTAHNHGFAVDAPIGKQVDAPFENGKYGKVFVSHIDLNDDVVEGLQCVDIPAFSVQYHPEAAAGPHDAAYLFDRFVDLMKTSKEENRNA
mgnify:CR=1 FL=1